MGIGLSWAPLGAAASLTPPNGSSSASTALPGSGGDSVQVTNTGTVAVAIKFSNVSGGAVATATGDFVIPGSTQRVIAMPIGTVDFALWGVGVSSTVYVQRGSGK